MPATRQRLYDIGGKILLFLTIPLETARHGYYYFFCLPAGWRQTPENAIT
jgi:hypothetical protein